MRGEVARSAQIATSHWETPDVVEEKFPYREKSFWLGRNPYEGENPIGFSDDRHVMLVAGNRGGKGVSVIVPNLCLWKGSVVVVDPKGENATLTAARRGQGSEHAKGMDQQVHVLDPMGVAKVDDCYRAKFNPFDALDPNSPHVIDDATRIADAIVEIGEGESRQWDEGARSLVRTLILHVLTHPHYEGRRNLLTVRRLILRGENELVAAMRDKGNDAPPSGHVVLWELARRSDALGGVIAAAADSFLESAKASPKQYNSYRIIAERSTEFLDSPGIAECVSESSFQLADLKADPNGVSIFLSLPQRYMSTHYRWLRMMISLAITEMETVEGQPKSDQPVLMVLDEFAGLRRMEIIENGVAQIAGYGVKLFFVMQSLEQLKSVYPDRWETFLANCGVRIFFATTDNFTNEYVSDSLGEEEIVRLVRNQSQSRSDTETITDTISENDSFQESTSTTRGDSDTYSRGGGSNRGGSFGSSSGFNRSVSNNESSSYGPTWFHILRRDRQSGSGSSSGSTYGSNRSSNFGTSRNWSKTRSTQRSSTSGTTTGRTTGSSHSVARGTQTGETEGFSEQIFKKRLVTKDEMAKLFTRIDDEEHRAYPGIALVSIAGEQPIIVRRTLYYEDILFDGLHDIHPDHQIIRERRKILSSENFDKIIFPSLKGAGTVKSKVLVGVGQRFLRGDVFGEIEISVLEDYIIQRADELKWGQAKEKIRFTFCAEADGIVLDINEYSDEQLDDELSPVSIFLQYDQQTPLHVRAPQNQNALEFVSCCTRYLRSQKELSDKINGEREYALLGFFMFWLFVLMGGMLPLWLISIISELAFTSSNLDDFLGPFGAILAVAVLIGGWIMAFRLSSAKIFSIKNTNVSLLDLPQSLISNDLIDQEFLRSQLQTSKKELVNAAQKSMYRRN